VIRGGRGAGASEGLLRERERERVKCDTDLRNEGHTYVLFAHIDEKKRSSMSGIYEYQYTHTHTL
jgi:hypothetical protein